MAGQRQGKVRVTTVRAQSIQKKGSLQTAKPQQSKKKMFANGLGCFSSTELGGDLWPNAT